MGMFDFLDGFGDDFSEFTGNVVEAVDDTFISDIIVSKNSNNSVDTVAANPTGVASRPETSTDTRVTAVGSAMSGSGGVLKVVQDNPLVAFGSVSAFLALLYVVVKK